MRITETIFWAHLQCQTKSYLKAAGAVGEQRAGLDHGVGHFRPLSITRQRHWLTYHFIAML